VRSLARERDGTSGGCDEDDDARSARGGVAAAAAAQTWRKINGLGWGK